MEIDHDKIDEAVLALMWLTLHDGCRAWKSFDWGATDRLYQKGFICDPANKAKSVVLTDEGTAESRGALQGAVYAAALRSGRCLPVPSRLPMPG
jgi:uncharacterized protein DUF6429